MRRTVQTTLALTLALTLGLVGCGSEAGKDGEAKKEAAKKDDKKKDDRSTTQKILSADDGVAAQQAVSQMLIMAEAGDWVGLVDSYYGEKHKFTKPGDKREVVETVKKFGKGLIEVLKLARETKPIVKGDVAEFKEDGETFYKLYKDKDGKWGFHL